MIDDLMIAFSMKQAVTYGILNLFKFNMNDSIIFIKLLGLRQLSDYGQLCPSHNAACN